VESKTISEYRGILGESVPFKGLDPIVLDHILGTGLMLEAKAGDVVFFEKLRGPGLYVVLKGEVEVFIAGKRPATRLNTLRPSDCFGEYSLIDGKESSASARALSATRLYFLPRGEFLRLTQQNAATGRTIYHNLLLFLIERLRQKDQPAPKKGAKRK
jgi:CRP-like cAMP-binding protein